MAQEIKPEKVTKPFQLLATWLAGLIILVSALLVASAQTYEVKWINCFYAISAISIIPIFLILIFLLQTKFRPQMQEDKYYSEWLANDYRKELKGEIVYYDINNKGNIKKWQK